MTSEDASILLHCIHNALWMADHESEMQAIDGYIAVLNPAQKARAIEMLREFIKDVR